MMKTPAYRLGVTKTGKVNKATTWTLRIGGSKHKVTLSKSWTHRVIITYDGHTVFENRFILRSLPRLMAEWDRDGAVYEMRSYDRVADRYELRVDGVKFSDLPRVDALTRQQSHQTRGDRSTQQRRANKAGVDNAKATSTSKAVATTGARGHSALTCETSTKVDYHGSGSWGGGGGDGGCGGGGGGDCSGGNAGGCSY